MARHAFGTGVLVIATLFVPSALIDTPTVGEPAENRMAFTLGTAQGDVGLGMTLELEL